MSYLIRERRLFKGKSLNLTCVTCYRLRLLLVGVVLGGAFCFTGSLLFGACYAF